MEERPFGVALVAGWFAVGAIVVAAMVGNFWRAMRIIDSPLGDGVIGGAMVLSALGAAALAWIATGIWRDRARARLFGGIVLAATAVVAMFRATTPWHWAVAAINIAAIVVLSRQRARSM